MGELVIRGLNAETLAGLEARAQRAGRPVADLAREMLEAFARLSASPFEQDAAVISEGELAGRRSLAGELAELRRRSVLPAGADSTLVIREARDSR